MGVKADNAIALFGNREAVDKDVSDRHYLPGRNISRVIAGQGGIC